MLPSVCAGKCSYLPNATAKCGRAPLTAALGSSRRCPSDCEPMLKEAGAAAFALQHTLQHSLAGSWFCTSCAALCAPRGESERQVADRYVVGPREVVDGAVRGADAHVPDEGQQPGDDGDRRPDDAVGVQVLRRGIAMCRRHSPHTRSSTELYVGLLPRCQMRLSGTGGGKVNAKHSRDERGVAARSPHVCPVASAVGTLITRCTISNRRWRDAKAHDGFAIIRLPTIGTACEQTNKRWYLRQTTRQKCHKASSSTPPCAAIVL